MPPDIAHNNRTASDVANIQSSVETASEETTSTFAATPSVHHRFEDDRTRISDDDDIVVLAHRNLIYRDDKKLKWPEEEVVDDEEEEYIVDEKYRMDDRNFRHHICEVGGCSDARCGERRGKSVGELKATKTPRLDKISRDMAEMKSNIAAPSTPVVAGETKHKEVVPAKDVKDIPKPKVDIAEDDSRRKKKLMPEEIRKKVTKGFILRQGSEHELPEEEKSASGEDKKKAPPEESKKAPQEEKKKKVSSEEPRKVKVKLADKEMAGPEESESESGSKEVDQKQKPPVTDKPQIESPTAIVTPVDDTKRKAVRDTVTTKQKPPVSEEQKQKSSVILPSESSVVSRKVDISKEETDEKSKPTRQKSSGEKTKASRGATLPSVEPKRRRKSQDSRKKETKGMKRGSVAPLSRRFSKPRKALTRGQIRRKVTKGFFVRQSTDNMVSNAQRSDTRSKGPRENRSEPAEKKLARPEGGRSQLNEEDQKRSTQREKMQRSKEVFRGSSSVKKVERVSLKENAQEEGSDIMKQSFPEVKHEGPIKLQLSDVRPARGSKGEQMERRARSGSETPPNKAEKKKILDTPSDLDDIVQRATWAGSPTPVPYNINGRRKGKKEAEKAQKKGSSGSDEVRGVYGAKLKVEDTKKGPSKEKSDGDEKSSSKHETAKDYGSPLGETSVVTIPGKPAEDGCSIRPEDQSQAALETPSNSDKR
ncbi:transcriptional regulator ATRX homolog [Varroa jacobsoni]|uniref:Uncharacterized protein n=1 Tax=Varroa destructor TaxID=109461 RepID=A0A7M7KLA2_VARDE|nr:transcriptional regulator ATRX homolog [Varroa destructor]XP_022668467.1 transcriptional regulator ATRX homolog [Varroa destructor]XP_022686295.1 transcriptional regulator ATRX homolog [Varroa jacobsoni]